MKLRLKTQDHSDIEVISPLLHNAIGHKEWMSQNHILVGRFCWEDEVEHKNRDIIGHRRYSLITIENVKKVFVPTRLKRFFLILGLHFANNILQIFTSSGTFKYVLDNLSIKLEDVGHQYVTKVVNPELYKH